MKLPALLGIAVILIIIGLVIFGIGLSVAKWRERKRRGS